MATVLVRDPKTGKMIRVDQKDAAKYQSKAVDPNGPKTTGTTTASASGAQGAAQAAMQGAGGADPTDRHLKIGGREAAMSEVQKDLLKSNPTQIMAMQEKLLRAGFYGSATRQDIAWGVADALTIAAYKNSLEYSADFFEAGSDKDFDSALNELTAARDKNGMNKNIDGPNNAITIANPQDLIDVLSNKAQDLVGHKVTATDLGNFFVNEYQKKQVEYQKALEQGGTVTQAPSADVAAENLIRRKMPNEVAAKDLSNTGADFFALLKGAS